MNKIKFKKIFLIATTACAMNAPLFAMANEALDESSKTLPLCSILESDIGLVAGKFFSPQDIAVINKTSRGVGTPLSIQFSIEVCAQYILNDQPVPREIKAILRNVTNPTEIEDITKAIAKRISHNSGGTFYRHNPLPPLLASFFRNISSAELDAVLRPPVNQDVLPAAMLHMKTCETFWVAEEKSTDHLTNLDKTLINASAKLYIAINDALNLPEGAVMPKHIIATEDEIKSKVHFSAIDALFKTYPNHELVIDFEEAESSHAFGNVDNDKLFPESLRNISLVGENLRTIGNRFLVGCSFLTSLTVSNSVTTIGNDFFWYCRNLTSFRIPNSVTTIGDYFLYGCENLTSLTIPNSVTTIGEGLLQHSTNMTSITIPERFRNSESLRDLPDEVNVTFYENID